jgi:hypothetical protein
VRARVGDRDVLVRLSAGSVVAGRVLAPDGRPHTSASVQATWKPNGHSWSQVDGSGRFRVQGVPPDALVDLRVHSWNPMGGTSGLRPAEVLGVAAGTQDVVVQLQTGVSIAGRVVTADGAVPTDMTARVSREGATAQQQAATVNPDGTFEVAGLAPGGYTLRIHRNRGTVAAEMRVDAPAKDVRVEVSPALKVSGRLEGPGSVEGFAVVGWVGGGTTGSAVTGADGTFSLEVVAGTPMRLTASKADDDRYALVEGWVATTTQAPFFFRLFGPVPRSRVCSRRGPVQGPGPPPRPVPAGHLDREPGAGLPGRRRGGGDGGSAPQVRGGGRSGCPLGEKARPGGPCSEARS